jgi:hypothetical protein
LGARVTPRLPLGLLSLGLTILGPSLSPTGQDPAPTVVINGGGVVFRLQLLLWPLLRLYLILMPLFPLLLVGKPMTGKPQNQTVLRSLSTFGKSTSD